jgi:hypothetical protein
MALTNKWLTINATVRLSVKVLLSLTISKGLFLT